MLIKWSRTAREDMLGVLAYFAALGEAETGRSIVSALMEATERLSAFPLSGRQGRIENTREMIPAKLPYILVYRIVLPDAVEIVRILHTSRLFPHSLSEDMAAF